MATEKTNNVSVKEDSSVKKEKTTKNTEDTVSKAEYDALKAQMDLIMQMMANMSSASNHLNDAAPSNSFNEEVKLVHLVERDVGLTTTMKISNLEINMSRFGEERTLDKRQAEELVGKYRSWFDKGIVALGAGSEEFASRLGVKSVTDYHYVDKNFVEKFANLNAVELESLYNQLAEGHKAFIIETFKKENIKGKDSRFTDAQKIEMLNRVSNGAMEGLLLDRRIKAQKENI